MATTRRILGFFLASAPAVLVGAAGLTGCAADPEPRGLAGSSWQLVSIQSPDDRQGSTTVPDPSVFTVEFGDDGQAQFQLDCNRGSGSYEVTPADDGVSGSLVFGPIATTLIGCPPGSLDQAVSQALGDVRGYLFAGDQLHMSRIADGGILNWSRT